MPSQLVARDNMTALRKGLVLSFLFGAALAAPNAFAYDCGTEMPAERLNRADVVFEGIVIASENAPNDAMSRYRIESFHQYKGYRQLSEAKTQIYVTENFKGKTNKVENLWIVQWGGGEGLYQPGSRAVFFAYDSEEFNRLESDLCTATFRQSVDDGYRLMNAEDFWKHLGRFELD